MTNLSKNQQLALLFLVAVGIVGAVAAGVTVPSAMGGPFGPRETLPTLSADNLVQPLVYKNPKNNKYFLRMAVQKPKQSKVVMLVVHDDFFKSPGIKSIDVVVKGKTAKGQTLVSGLKKIKPIPRRGASPWREYYVPETMLRSTVPDKFDFFDGDFDWLSFDLELDFPVSATWREQHDFLVGMAGTLYVLFLRGEMVDKIASWNDDPVFRDSIDNLIGPPPPRKR